MSDISDFTTTQWALAMSQANGDRVETVAILATATAFAAADGDVDIDEVISLVRDDYETAMRAKTDE